MLESTNDRKHPMLQSTNDRKHSMLESTNDRKHPVLQSTNDRKHRMLQPCQIEALEFIRQSSSTNEAATRYIHRILDQYAIPADTYTQAIKYLRTGTRTAIHFHPDRLTRNGQPVATGLLATGQYVSQYETGISNGSPTAYTGGERDNWELTLFGGAYHKPAANVKERPKYGALEVFPYPDGPSPRFGSCYFLLTPDTLSRSTFTFGGSQESEALLQTGAIDHFHPVLAALLSTVEKTGSIFGKSNLTIPLFFETLAATQPRSPEGFETLPPDPRSPEEFETLPLGRALDSFVEVQIHGDIDFSRDVSALVCDPCYAGTVTGDQLIALSAAHNFPLYWHSGFKMPLAEMPEYFRGYEIRSLANRITPGPIIDPAVLGEAANSFTLDPASWSGFGDEEEMLTRFRRLWHAMVVFQ